MAASPGLVNDSGLHQVSAYLGGLTPNTIYYYQLAGLEDSMAVNGGIQQFYVGDCEVPNCDFEAWDSIFDWQPVGWNIIGSVTRVPSYDGSWAVQLTGGNIDQVGGVVLGEPGNGNPGISGGIPFTTRPDSIGFHAKYNIVQGDTAYVFLIFVVNGNYMDMDLFPITGNTNGNWVSVWHAIPYTGSYTPDTLIAGIVSSNVFKNNGNTNANSILTIDKVQFTGTGATLPNYNFELWDTIYVPRLQSWSCNGYNTLVNEPSTDIQQTSHRVSGNYAVRLQTDSINQSSVNLSIYPNPNNGGPTFPLSLHHTTLNFFAEFIPQPQDAFSVMFTEFKQGSQIAGAYGNFDSLMTGYTPISIPINYYSQILIPDSANLSITLGTGNARAGSTLYLDDISFDGFRVSGIQNPGLLQSVRGLLFTLFPNPASESIRVQMLKDDTYTLQIFDTHGVMLTTRTFNGKQSDIDISGLANGTYIARVGEGENAVARKFIIAR